MENVFDSLCSALAESEIKDLFLKSEGVDLMVLMMKYIFRLFLAESILIVPLPSLYQRQDASALTCSQGLRPCDVQPYWCGGMQGICRGIRPQVLIQRFYGKGLH